MPLADTLEISQNWAPKGSTKPRRRNNNSASRAPRGADDRYSDDERDSPKGGFPGRREQLFGSALLYTDVDEDEIATNGMQQWQNHQKFKGSWLPEGPSLIVLGEHGMDDDNEYDEYSSGADDEQTITGSTEPMDGGKRVYEDPYGRTPLDHRSSSSDDHSSGAESDGPGPSGRRSSDVGGSEAAGGRPSGMDAAAAEYRRLTEDVLMFVNEGREKKIVYDEPLLDDKRKGQEDGCGAGGCTCDFWAAVTRAFGGGEGGGVWKVGGSSGNAGKGEMTLSEYSFDGDGSDDQWMSEALRHFGSEEEESDEEEEEDERETPEYIQRQVEEVRVDREREVEKRKWLRRLLPKPLRKKLVVDPTKQRGQGQIRGRPNFLYTLKERELEKQLQVAKPVKITDPIPKEARLWKDEKHRWY